MPACEFILTPAESKRLIARGVLKHEKVEKALDAGIVTIPTGSTNAYIVGELLDSDFNRSTYLSGITIPSHKKRSDFIKDSPHPDVIFRNGKLDPDLDRRTALQHMQPGDVFIKGANALNYSEQLAGILIGGFGGGGTIGSALGHIQGRRLHLIIPVGLEKCVAGDIEHITRHLNEPREFDPDAPRMISVRGIIITEIEALKILTGVDVHHIASGGIGGAEGAVRLLAEGSSEQLTQAKEVINEISGETPFWPMN